MSEDKRVSVSTLCVRKSGMAYMAGWAGLFRLMAPVPLILTEDIKK